jgi:hypothetical protein
MTSIGPYGVDLFDDRRVGAVLQHDDIDAAAAPDHRQLGHEDAEQVRLALGNEGALGREVVRLITN